MNTKKFVTYNAKQILCMKYDKWFKEENEKAVTKHGCNLRDCPFLIFSWLDENNLINYEALTKFLNKEK